jgi:hypothetical protein
MRTLDELYKDAWFRFSPEFRRFWMLAPGPHILASLQQSQCINCNLVRDWLRGGCRTWQEGVVGWIAASGVTTQCHFDVRVYAVATDETDASHAIFSLSLDGESFFVDYQGVWTPQEVEARLVQEYRYDDYHLKPWEQVDPRWGMIPFDLDVSRLIERALFEVVGPFAPYHFLNVPELDVV